MNNNLLSTDEFIKRKKRKKTIKKTLLLFVFLVSIFVILCLKLPYFNISKISVEGNNNISKENILDLSKFEKGTNIFYTNTNIAKENILSNAYIESVTIKKTLPDKIKIFVKEREALFYNMVGKKYYIISKNSCLLEKRDNIKNMNLIKVDGFNVDKSKIGKKLNCDDERKLGVLTEIGELLINNNSNVKFTYLDLKNILDIKIYANNVLVKIGVSDNIKDKLNKAINILKRKELQKSKKAYIDVSFDGNPVFRVEK